MLEIGILIALLLIGLYSVRKWLLALLTPKNIPGIPAYPDPYPIIGDIPRIAASVKQHDRFTAFFDQITLDLGPVAQVRFPGKCMVVIDDYEASVAVLTSPQFDRTMMTGRVFKAIVPTGQIATVSNEMWKRHRRMIAPALSSRSLEMMTPRVVATVKELITLFDAKRVKAQGRPWEVLEDFVSSAMVCRKQGRFSADGKDIISGVAFGETWDIVPGTTRQVEGGMTTGSSGEAIFHTRRPDIASAALYLMDSVPAKASFPEINLFFQRCMPSFRRRQEMVHDFLRRKLAVSRASMASKGDAGVQMADNTLDMITARELRGDRLPDNEILDEVLLYLVAGTETSAVALSWYTKYMTNHPDVQRKLRTHLLERIPELQDRDLTFADVDPGNVPYLEAVMQESLRLSRIAGTVVREAREDTVVLGHAIPRGTIVLTTGSFNYKEGEEDFGSRDIKTRKTGYWKAGTGRQFLPERWLASDGSFDANAGPSMPFSSGPRGCQGKNLAMRMVIAYMTLAFFFAPLDDKFNSQKGFETITLHPVQSFVKLEKW